MLSLKNEMFGSLYCPSEPLLLHIRRCLRMCVKLCKRPMIINKQTNNHNSANLHKQANN